MTSSTVIRGDGSTEEAKPVLRGDAPFPSRGILQSKVTLKDQGTHQPPHGGGGPSLSTPVGGEEDEGRKAYGAESSPRRSCWTNAESCSQTPKDNSGDRIYGLRP